MSIKDGWKEAGKGIGKSFAGLGKAIVKSAKVGVDKVLDEEPENKEGGTGLKESWSEVGHSFGDAGLSFGKAVAGTASGVLDKIDGDDEVTDTEAEVVINEDGETVINDTDK